MKDYQMKVAVGDKIMALQSFKKIKNVLPSHTFVWVYESCVISLNKTESIGRYRIKITDQLLPINDTY
jgi:hypothetical protein